MDIRQLSAFIAVFEERNITSAAQRLFTSQPTLSVTIRQLEEALGTTLFQRLPRGVDVTDDARTLYPQARRLLAEAHALSNQFRQRNDRLALDIGVEGISPPATSKRFWPWPIKSSRICCSRCRRAAAAMPGYRWRKTAARTNCFCHCGRSRLCWRCLPVTLWQNRPRWMRPTWPTFSGSPAPLIPPTSD